jgi:glycogen debranching enzyme
MAMERRPTPADPLPGGRPGDRPLSEVVRELPPELGPNAVAVLEGISFMHSNALGDVPRGSIGGFVHEDTRLLNRWELTLNGSSLLALDSGAADHYSAAFFLTNAELPGLPANRMAVRRQRFVGDGLHERIDVQCFGGERVSCQLRLGVGTDFADILEIKETVRDRSQQITRAHAPDGSRLVFSYRKDNVDLRTEVLVKPPAGRVEGDDLVWDLRLEPGQQWTCELSVPARYGPGSTMPTHRHFGEVFDGDAEDPASRWRAAAPMLESDSDLLRNVFGKSVWDLVSLRVRVCLRGKVISLPAAGLPWFLSIFGRDTLITAYQTVSFGPRLARGALLELASHQGTVRDDFRDEEPGKILHEVRNGELTRTGVKPYSPYYGTADATQLWLIVLSEYWRWTCDDDLVRELRDNAYAALRWIDEYGDRDGDGYVEYATRSPEGLGNQCWRDSWNGVLFADGAMPVLPIATCEIQGYTYDAKLRMAELADGPLNDPQLASRLRTQADELRERFNRDFWIDERGGYYAIGLDGDKRRIDSMTSNMGQLLWSGIVPRERAAVIARQLMSPHLFSGWGIRTTSTLDRAFNPIGYHMGTVWPHDNSLIAHGLARYGFRQEANRIALAMLQAADFTRYRLPEAFSGYDRSVGRTPVRYPTACSPQAWASGAPLLLLRTMLGLDARAGELIVDPDLPEEMGQVTLTGTNAFGTRWNVEAVGTRSHVRLAP